MGGSFPYYASDSNDCKAWKLAATVCTTAPVAYYDNLGVCGLRARPAARSSPPLSCVERPPSHRGFTLLSARAQTGPATSPEDSVARTVRYGLLLSPVPRRRFAAPRARRRPPPSPSTPALAGARLPQASAPTARSPHSTAAPAARPPAMPAPAATGPSRCATATTRSRTTRSASAARRAARGTTSPPAAATPAGRRRGLTTILPAHAPRRRARPPGWGIITTPHSF